MATPTFKEFVLDQLSAIPELRAKAMFGGHGLYSGNSFFGILVEGRIYFKVDETSRATFIERGTGPFTYLRATKTMTMNYYEVPPDVLENRNELADWAACAIKIAANSARKPRR